MKCRKVVLMYSNPELARATSEALGAVAYQCAVALSIDHVRRIARSQEPTCVIADLEAMSLAQIKELQQEYDLPVICVHRNASDSLWIETMSAGVVDFCYPDDCMAIKRALQQVKRAHPMALASAA